MEYDHDQHSPSFRQRIKLSIFAPCCFTYHAEEPSSPSSSAASSVSFTASSDDDAFHSPTKASGSSRVRSRAQDLPEEIKEKCSGFFSKIGARGAKAGRRSNNTAEFRYDPMSYALNFDDEASRMDEFPLRNFSARLPPSPPQKISSEKTFSAAVSREIAAWS